MAWNSHPDVQRSSRSRPFAKLRKRPPVGSGLRIGLFLTLCAVVVIVLFFLERILVP